ncbi:hypothetical protein V8C86DRAFT_734485 [Haematococcus lacustris]
MSFRGRATPGRPGASRLGLPMDATDMSDEEDLLEGHGSSAKCTSSDTNTSRSPTSQRASGSQQLSHCLKELTLKPAPQHLTDHQQPSCSSILGQPEFLQVKSCKSPRQSVKLGASFVLGSIPDLAPSSTPASPVSSTHSPRVRCSGSEPVTPGNVAPSLSVAWSRHGVHRDSEFTVKSINSEEASSLSPQHPQQAPQEPSMQLGCPDQCHGLQLGAVDRFSSPGRSKPSQHQQRSSHSLDLLCSHLLRASSAVPYVSFQTSSRWESQPATSLNSPQAGLCSEQWAAPAGLCTPTGLTDPLSGLSTGTPPSRTSSILPAAACSPSTVASPAKPTTSVIPLPLSCASLLPNTATLMPLSQRISGQLSSPSAQGSSDPGQLCKAEQAWGPGDGQAHEAGPLPRPALPWNVPRGDLVSDIHTKEGRETVVEMLRESIAPDDVPAFHSYIHGGSTLRGMRYVHQAAVYADTPLFMFLLTHGGSLELGTAGGVTPLLLLCYLFNQPAPSETQGPRKAVPVQARLAALSYLLAVGADHSVHGPLDLFQGGTALHMVAQAGYLEACQLLLAHGADPTALDANGSTPAALLPATELLGQYQAAVEANAGRARPPRLCVCGSGQLWSHCHAGPDEWRGAGPCLGVLVGPEEICPCASGRKYRRCCMRFRLEWRLRGGSYIKSMPCTDIPSSEELAACTSGDEQSEVNDDYTDDLSSCTADSRAPSTTGTFSEDDETQALKITRRAHQRSGDTVEQLLHLRKRAMCGPLLAQGLVDPAFYFVLTHRKVSWMPRGCATPGLDEKVKKARMLVWNSVVDLYIATHCPGSSPLERRLPLTVEQLTKIGLDQGPLFKRCWGCGRVEDAPSTFTACSGCAVAVYCGPSCCEEDSNRGHTADCAAGQVRPRCGLPSQEALDSALAASADLLMLPLDQQLVALQDRCAALAVSEDAPGSDSAPASLSSSPERDCSPSRGGPWAGHAVLLHHHVVPGVLQITRSGRLGHRAATISGNGREDVAARQVSS